MNLNNVILAGNLTRDPQVRFLATETAVANFGLAINRRFKGADGTLKEETTFVDVEAWGRTAELVGQHLAKGRQACVEGRLKLDTWEKDGQKHSKLKVIADRVHFLGAKPAAATATDGPAPATSAPAPAAKPADEEPPF